MDDTPLLLAWHGSPDRLVALVAGPAFVDERVLASARASLTGQRARLVVQAADGRTVLGTPLQAGAVRAQRAASDTRLPWTLVVADADPGAVAAESASRGRLVVAGLLALVAFVVAGSFFIIRAVNREVKVARLQTGFVSAVSREFRTPLASMRQLSEMLVDGRVPSETRRREYYGTLQHESERLHRLVEALLRFGRMDSGAREYRFEPVEIEALVAGVVNESARRSAIAATPLRPATVQTQA